MKIIISRKGFDSGSGGYASPILPDGTLMSIPIPDSSSGIPYHKLNGPNERSYLETMKELGLPYSKNDSCHLDPDIHKEVFPRVRDWRPIFGQVGAAQSHLQKNEVGRGDLFLFFGWFRRTIFEDGVLTYDPKDPGTHIFFGYFQIDSILHANDEDSVPKWATYHPHVKSPLIKRNNNVIYTSKKKLTITPGHPGAGVLQFHEKRILTKEGHSRSKWCLPAFLQNYSITYHNEESWKDGYFQ